MFYTIVKELTRVRKNNSVYKEYGEDFYRLVYYFSHGTNDIKGKSLASISRMAKALDVPAKFIINLLSYEGVEEIWIEKDKKSKEKSSRKCFSIDYTDV